MTEMTVSEFEKSLRAGLGRCVLFLKGCADKEKYRAAVLSACLNDYAYDRQCEGSRAWYTYQLLSCFNDDEYFYSRTAEKLTNVLGGNCDDWAFEHLSDMVFQFALHGNDGAKNLIHKIYSELLDRLSVKIRKPYEVDFELHWLDLICMRAAEVCDIAAVIKIAADLGGLFKCNDRYDADDFDWFTFEADERFGKDKITLALKGAADPDGNITAYVRSVEQNVQPIPVPTDEQKEQRAAKRAERKKRHVCDTNRILRDIKRYDNADVDGEWHSVALDIVGNEDTVFPLEAYMYVYTGLCACCRYDVVQAMNKHGLLSDELLRECEFDSYAETREFVRRIRNSEL